MPSESYLPKREADLVTWSNNFESLVRVNFAQYGVTTAQATAYTALNTAWRNAYQAANDNSTRTPSSITTKNTAKANLIDGPGGIRELVAIIQGFPGTTNTMRSDLEITVRDFEPTPVPAPADPPQITIASVIGRTVKIRLRDINNPDRRAKPEGVQSAAVLWFVGEEPPSTLLGWNLAGNASRTNYEVEFPATVEPGAKVWITAYWLNPRSESGPAATPVNTFVQYGGLAQAA